MTSWKTGARRCETVNTYWVRFQALLIGVPSEKAAVELTASSLIESLKEGDYSMLVAEEVTIEEQEITNNDSSEEEDSSCKPSSLN